MVALQRTEFALEHVKKHLEEHGSSGSLIESFLVQYLLVSFYSEMEERVKETIKSRLHFKGDKKLENFVYKTHESMIKRIKKSDIKDIVLLFGDDCKDKFGGSISEMDISLYSSAIENRHITSHGSGGTITLVQMEKALGSAEKILDSLKRAIQ